jgi:hypothetical protein
MVLLTKIVAVVNTMKINSPKSPAAKLQGIEMKFLLFYRRRIIIRNDFAIIMPDI